MLPALGHATEVAPQGMLIRSKTNGYGYGYGPTIVYDGSKFNMLYCSSPYPEKNGLDSIRFSTSTNGLTWTTPKVILDVTGGAAEGSTCDPSVVRYQAPGDSQPYYYLFYSGNAGGNIETLMFVARSSSIEGPYAKWTKSGTWEVNATNPQPIIETQYENHAGEYGAGQQSVVATPTGLKAWWGDSTLRNGDNLFDSTKTPTSWPSPTDNGLSYNGPEGDSVTSVDVKYDSLSGRYVMFYINSGGGESSSLRERTSLDGIKWSSPTILCSTGPSCIPAYAHNPGISGDASGDLIQGRGLLVYGAPGADCEPPGEPECRDHWDLFGSIINPASSGVVYSSALPVPEAKTYEQTNLNIHQATLHATVNPLGAATTHHFEWGTQKEFEEEKYGNESPVPDASAGSGSSAVSVEREITGLTGETTYHYRVVATGSRGTSYGEDVAFKTLPDTPANLAAMPVNEAFDGGSGSVSSFGSNWATDGWAWAKGEDSSSGWRATDAYSKVDGAYYKSPVVDLGSGTAVAATMTENPSNISRNFSLWLDLADPDTKREGYELRFVDTATNAYEVKLARWDNSVETVLATKTGYTFNNGNSLALTDEGGTVSAWTNTGSGYAKLLSAADSTYSGGYTAISASGNITRLSNFKAGDLLPNLHRTTKPCVFNYGTSLEVPKQSIFYVGNDGQLWRYNYDGVTWVNEKVTTSEAPAPNSSPACLVSQNNVNNPRQWVFYTGADHQVWMWYWNGTSASNVAVGSGEVVMSNTNPTVANFGTNPEFPKQSVFYTGADGQIWEWYYDGKTWTNGKATTHAAAPNTSPIVLNSKSNVENPKQWVFYTGADNHIWLWYWNGSTAENSTLSGGEAVMSNTNLTVANFGTNPEFPKQSIFYTGADGQIWEWYYDGKTWTNGKATTHAADPNTSPIVLSQGNVEIAKQWVFYTGADNHLWVWYWSGSAASNSRIFTGAPVMPGTSPTAANFGSNPEYPKQSIFFMGEEHELWEQYYDGKYWSYGKP